MGASESTPVLPPAVLQQVPGFNPICKDNGVVPPRTTNRNPKGQTLPLDEKDVFFSRVDIIDHISPIFDEDLVRLSEQLNESENFDMDINALLGELDIGDSGGNGDDDRGGADLLLGRSDEDDGFSDSSESSSDDRGLFHHEVDPTTNQAAPSITSPEAHPIRVVGACSVGEMLELEDCSSWAAAFPILNIEWYLSNEIGDQNVFDILRQHSGPTFIVPAAAIGKYIRVIARRRVENQLTDSLKDDIEGGVFDPHIANARHTRTTPKIEFVDVESIAIVGPILISGNLSLYLLRYLGEARFECDVILHNTEITEQTGDAFSVWPSKAPRERRVNATMSVTFRQLILSYALARIPKKHRKLDDGVLTSEAWLMKIARFASTAKELGNLNAELGAPVDENFIEVVTLDLKYVTFHSLKKSRATLVIAVQPRAPSPSRPATTIGHRSNAPLLIRLDINSPTSSSHEAHQIKQSEDLSSEVFYTLLAFQACRCFRHIKSSDWQEYATTSEIGRAQDLIQRFLEYMTSGSVTSAPALETVSPAKHVAGEIQ